MKTTFIVPGLPRGKERPRVTRYGAAYTPKKTADYERAVAWQYRAENSGRTFKGPVRVRITALFPAPKSAKRVLKDKIAAGEVVPYPHRPDADNIAKIILDALNGVAWHDDGAVTELEVHKYYGVLIGVVVTISGEEET